MTAFAILLIAIVVGWIISGSVFPAATFMLSAVVFYTLLLCRFPLNRLLFASGVMLAITLQSLAFKNGYAGIIYEDLPVSFHVGMGCFLWSWMVSNAKDGSREKVGGWYFYSQLAGSVLIFWSAASVEIFQFIPYWVRVLAAAPLVLTLWQEYHRREAALRQKHTWLLLILIPLAGALCSGSRASSGKLKAWLKKEEAFNYQLAGDGQDSTRGSVSLTAGDGIVDLPRKANIVVDKKTRFYLKVQSIEDFLALTRNPLYLRTSTVSIFETNEKILPITVGRWLLDGDDGQSDLITTLPERKPDNSLNYAVVLPKEDAKLIPLVEGTNRVYADEVYHFAEGRYQLSQEPVGEWTRFSAIGPRFERSSKIIPANLNDPSNPHLSLPETKLAKRVQFLTKQIIDEKSPKEAISTFIQGQCRYSLKYKNPDNLSPVENLLFGEQKGHCELFASATVMMLRSAGIPSRIAYGYTGGASNRDQLAIAFRGSDIHAWAEILNEQGEWRIFDTTPNNRGAARLPQNRLGGNIDWKMASFNPEAGLIVDEDEIGGQSSLALVFASISDWAANYFVWIILMLVILFTIGRWLIKRSSPAGMENDTSALNHLTNTTGSRNRPDFVDAILTLGENAGFPRPAGATLREYVNSLHDQGIGYADLSEAVEYFYETQYGQSATNPALEKQYLRSIKASRKGSG